MLDQIWNLSGVLQIDVVMVGKRKTLHGFIDQACFFLFLQLYQKRGSDTGIFLWILLNF